MADVFRWWFLVESLRVICLRHPDMIPVRARESWSSLRWELQRGKSMMQALDQLSPWEREELVAEHRYFFPKELQPARP